MKDLRKLDQYEQRRFDVCHSLAKEYLSTKSKEKCYLVSGSDSHSEGEILRSMTLPLTDEQVEAIKSNLVEVFNGLYPDDPVKDWNEFEEGGWICPNVGAGGNADLGRLTAFQRASWRLRGEYAIIQANATDSHRFE